MLDYVPRTTVVAVQRSRGGCIVTDARGDRYAAGPVVVCDGADCHILFPDLFAASGLRMCKLQMMRPAPRPGAVLPHAVLSGLSIRRYPAFASCPSYGLLRDQPIDVFIRDHGIHLLFKGLPRACRRAAGEVAALSRAVNLKPLALTALRGPYPRAPVNGRA